MAMEKLEGIKQVRKFLVDCGINKNHIFRIYNDKRKVGRRYKIILAVLNGANTGELAISDDALIKLSSGLQLHNAENVFISQGKIEFKIK